jgi:acyl phosphate:glycerol-3-phosphate acyltransferase
LVWVSVPERGNITAMEWAAIAGLVLVTYLLGAVPFGLLVGLWRGVDVRTAGSKNIGASNVGRLLGRKYFFLVFFLDAAKGAVPMLVGAKLTAGLPESPLKYAAWLAVGMAALLGHVFPIYLGFKGGKGVATAAGVMLGLWPYYTLPAIPALLTFAAVLSVTRIISISSMLSASAFPVFVGVAGWLLGWQVVGYRWPLLAFAVFVGLMVIWRHRSNIARLRAGTEPRIGQRPVAPQEPVQQT